MKNILLAVSGLTPQVLTETLYALHQNHRTVDAIHVITTREGRDRIHADLLAGGKGHYHRYLADYGIREGAIDFGGANIHVIGNGDGSEAADIVQEDDNARLLNKCLELSFRFTDDPKTAVFFSIAGGRKTMGACLTLAAQIYGRPQDRLYHVLVSPEFESSREFFYPPKTPKPVALRNGSGQRYYMSTRYARVHLVHMPFFSVRRWLRPEFLEKPNDPGTLMLSLVREERDRLTVNLAAGKIVYKGIELDLMPAWMALYAFFAMQKKNCPEKLPDCRNCAGCFLDVQAVLEGQQPRIELYRRVADTRPIDEMSSTGIVNLSPENFNSYKSRINAAILQTYGPYALEKLQIASKGKRPNTRYGLSVDKNDIEIVL